jgi:hypothetical protein
MKGLLGGREVWKPDGWLIHPLRCRISEIQMSVGVSADTCKASLLEDCALLPPSMAKFPNSSQMPTGRRFLTSSVVARAII